MYGSVVKCIAYISVAVPINRMTSLIKPHAEIAYVVHVHSHWQKIFINVELIGKLIESS